ncbi:hypothetical protein GCM10011571_14230 [Marinithermofilum abyssi]|uniref:Resolvase/invertase-type recombinase catalytic domain-containing protein n=1 Tax=Marinithermofilum abyssi TaxID=1571185 RepID=A0A8J2YCB3_9BACL|nr:recombinase family protein [Marinithermofilum abyssi]GGE13910.1 hypothetical protein GCM10011571_14230 [Marinithermofilum abyssi]
MEGTSLDGQIGLCQKKIHELGLAGEIEVYKEAGVSGEDIDQPEMNRLREDIQKKSITHIVCTHPDRLSRNLVDKLLVCKEIDQNDVELWFVDTEYKDTPEGQLFFNMQSAIAQYELSMNEPLPLALTLRSGSFLPSELRNSHVSKGFPSILDRSDRKAISIPK